MKILFTGPSSFSGMWFIEELARRGHTVIAMYNTKHEEYQGVRLSRVEHAKSSCNQIFSCYFGSQTCLDAIEMFGPIDLFCHHTADVSAYKSPDFDYVYALRANTLNIKKVLEKLKEHKCNKFLYTGSVFEPQEGLSSDQPRAVSPYGLSKGLTSEVLKYYTLFYGLKLGKFVVPNPFGPYEEGRFTSYLAKTWLQKGKPTIDFPLYVRDNIPISLLAKSYADFAESLTEQPGFSKLNPSYCPETQVSFVARFSREMGSRWNLPCDYEVKNQLTFPEPRVRINSDLIDPTIYNWNETLAWDELASFYRNTNP